MNRQILDDEGQPIPRRTTCLKRLEESLVAKWKVILPIVMSCLVSVAALAVSIWSAHVATRDSEVTRRLSKLEFHPVLELQTVLNPVGNITPFWQVTNTGPVEAVQVKVQFFTHWYSSKLDMIQIAGKTGGPGTTSIIETIKPQEVKGFEFPRGFLDTNARLYDPPQHNILEILITYRRPQDLNEYSESAYYFVNADGLWVPEMENSIRGAEPYESMRAALSRLKRTGPGSPYMEWGGDILHVNE